MNFYHFYEFKNTSELSEAVIFVPQSFMNSRKTEKVAHKSVYTPNTECYCVHPQTFSFKPKIYLMSLYVLSVLSIEFARSTNGGSFYANTDPHV